MMFDKDNDFPPTAAARALRNITDEQRASIKRILNGDAAQDLIRRGAVHDILRNLRTDPVKSLEYQKALSDVSRAVTNLTAYGETPNGD